MKKNLNSIIIYFIQNTYLLFLLLFPIAPINAQTLTSPQVNFSQRTSASSPSQTIYNIKGDFTMLGNTNLTLQNYATTTDNQSNIMKYVDIDGDASTLNSSMATLELSNSGENSAEQNCSTVIFAGLYWTGKSDDANETFTINNTNAYHNSQINNTNYIMTVTRGGSSNNYYPIYSFTANGNSYVFSFTNAAVSGTSTVTLKLNGVAQPSIDVTYASGKATFTTPFTSNPAFGTSFTINSLTRNTNKTRTEAQYQVDSYATYATSKNLDKKVISIKGPGASAYTAITAKPNGAISDIRFPGALNSGIFIGYQEITDYVKTYGPGAYTVADIALTEGTNSNPGLSGGWIMVVIYQNPIMKSRAVTLFDGYAYVNGQLAGGGEYGNISISGFTTAGSGDVNMKLGVMAAEGDIGLTGDYLAVQKLTADPNKAYNSTNYLTLNHSGNLTTNFFNSSLFPVPTGANSNPNLQNNTGIDCSMFTVPNASNLVIGNNQTATTFRFGSTSDVFTIFGFAMSVDAYIPEPNGLISVNSINNVTNPTVLNALPGQTINYSLNLTNEGTEATNNTLITIPIPPTAIFNVGGIISYHTYNGFSTGNAPYYDSGTNKIIWNLGTLPITAGHPEYIYADLSFDLNVSDNCSIILNEGCTPEVTLETGTITGSGAVSGSSFTKYFFQGYDNTSCHLPIDGSIVVTIDSSTCLSTMAGDDLSPLCGLESVQLAATAGTTGIWSIVSGPSGGGETFSDSTNPFSEFYSPNTGIYTLRWTIPANGSCPEISDDVQISIGLCNSLDFDGTDDHVNFNTNFNLDSGSFSIETWIKPGVANATIQTIFSKRNSIALSDGYDLRLVNNIISFHWNNGNSITSDFPISTERWYHIVVTFNGTSYRLYIDGISVQDAVAGTNPTSNGGAKCILGAMIQSTVYPYLPTNYFNGWMQELRIWNIALTEDQAHQMMNQKIENNSDNVYGSIVPLIVPGLTWTNLSAYYQMAQPSDIVNGYLIDKTNNANNGRLIGIITTQPETAPLPYTSDKNQDWSQDNTWTNYPVWDVPNSIGIDNSTKIDWNIVETSNNITSNTNKTVLGLLVNDNTLSAINDTKIEVSHYLKLDGKLDLVGKSQLVQTEESILDVNSSGSLERDQQGQTNLYNYNYWSSPVSAINTETNNKDYSINEVMKDGTYATPKDIVWIGGYDGSPSNPISIARYWLYKFDNYVNEYYNWAKITETDLVQVGLGYTMKGSGAEGTTQNYTFVGKPNNGTITKTVGDDQLLLTGNPYPSAIDATEFITDNLASNTIDGTLYFWEHYPSNDTHILREYQGGYAERNLTGGLPPVAPSLISGLGSSTRVPGQFIPVGQGFFVNGKPGAGGTLIYKNSQRGFHKEDEIGVSNPMFKTKTNTKTAHNANDPIAIDTLAKIRIGFNFNNYHRQVLLGFMNEKATSGIDYGYDAITIDDYPNDMYFLNGENQLVIQGDGFFDPNTSFPIGVKTTIEGKASFLIDALENFKLDQPIFIYDNVTDTYNDIRNGMFEVNLPVGVFNSRFSLRFKDNTLNVEQNTISDAIQINHIQNDNSLLIINKSLNTIVEKVILYTILGQPISNWKIENQDQQNIKIPIKNLNSGIYIVKLQTSNEEVSKKVIVLDK